MRISDWSSAVCSSDLFDWAAAEGRACLLLDYAGCGLSGGLFADQTLLDWRGDVLDLIDAKAEGAVIQIGRASCRERVCQYVSISVVDVSLKKKKTESTASKTKS